MSVTLEVSKPDKSKLVRLVQWSNIERMSVTLEVSKPDKSKLVRLVQSMNIAHMSVTLEVSKQFPNLIVFRFTKS